MQTVEFTGLIVRDLVAPPKCAEARFVPIMGPLKWMVELSMNTVRKRLENLMMLDFYFGETTI